MPSNNYVRTLRGYLKRHNSPLAPYAKLIARMEAKHKLPQGIIAGISGAETSYATAGKGPGMFNAWGWMTGAGPPNQRAFPNWQSAIRQYAGFLGKNYFPNGPAPVASIERKYVGYTNSPWLTNVSAAMRAVGGNPGGGSSPIVGGPSSLPSVTQTTAAATAITNLRFPNLKPSAPINRLPSSKLQGALLPLILHYSRSNSSMMAPLLMMFEAASSEPTVPAGPVAPNPMNPRSPRNATGRIPSGAQFYKAGKGLLLKPPSYVLQNTTHQTSGLGGYPAYDFMAAAGTPVYAPYTGRIRRTSGHPGGTAGGAAGFSIYLAGGGGDGFITHLDWARQVVKQGQRVKRGQLIGYVMNYPGGAHHVHFGFNSGG
jgi:murein DD-endopeptidase MepM/ murein hydrolase activator NlpD